MTQESLEAQVHERVDRRFGIGQHFVVSLPDKSDSRGGLAVIEPGISIPFTIARAYYLYGVPPDARRGGHAHRDLQQLLIAVAGSFVVDVVTATDRTSYRLDSPTFGLYVGPWVWREMRNFSPGAVCLALASMAYDESDYVRSFEEFTKAVSSVA